MICECLKVDEKIKKTRGKEGGVNEKTSYVAKIEAVEEEFTFTIKSEKTEFTPGTFYDITIAPHVDGQQ